MEPVEWGTRGGGGLALAVALCTGGLGCKIRYVGQGCQGCHSVTVE